MSNKKDSKVSFESKVMNCKGCQEKVKNVDKNAVSVLCWRCSSGMTQNKTQESYGSKIGDTPKGV
jgi:hypothetical protein